MTSRFDRVDTEDLIRNAIVAEAATLFARGIKVTVHIDNRLPKEVLGCQQTLTTILKRGLTQTIDLETTRRIILGLWLDRGMTLQVCRISTSANPPPDELFNCWLPPPGSGLDMTQAVPKHDQCGDDVDSIFLSLPCECQSDVSRIGDSWGNVFQGLHVAHVFTRAPHAKLLVRSLEAIGLTAQIGIKPDEIMSLAREAAHGAARGGARAGTRAGARSGKMIDILVLDCTLPIDTAVDIARQFRSDPALAGALIVMNGAPIGTKMCPQDVALFDAVPSDLIPWHRLTSHLYGLIRASREETAQDDRKSTLRPCMPKLDGKRILVAEDVQTNQVLLRAVLEPTGAMVEVVPDGSAVVERHQTDPADLILMDLNMPGMGGISAARQIRALGGALGSVCVVALTAYTSAADRRSALAAGMDGFLAKPIVLTDLFELIRRVAPSICA